MTRDEFRQIVLSRDKHKCVVCKSDAVDAHHVMERRLFSDGGYVPDNGVSVCGPCHVKAEKTLITPEELRAAAGITKAVLPEHLYPDYEYDKWGNIVNACGTRVKGELFHDESVQKILGAVPGLLSSFLPYVKYPRTFHLPFSHGRTKDDRVIKDCSQFEGKNVVATLKMDGENTTGYWDGYVHARSLDSVNHESRNWVKNLLSAVLHELPQGWRICGENLFAKHSIPYSNLGSFFHLFSVWDDKNECLSFEDTEEWAALLGLKPVRVLYRGVWDEDAVQSLYQPELDGNQMEGFVVRIADSFPYAAFSRSVAKFVRADHVQTNQHWIKARVTKNVM